MLGGSTFRRISGWIRCEHGDDVLGVLMWEGFPTRLWDRLFYALDGVARGAPSDGPALASEDADGFSPVVDLQSVADGAAPAELGSAGGIVEDGSDQGFLEEGLPVALFGGGLAEAGAVAAVDPDPAELDGVGFDAAIECGSEHGFGGIGGGLEAETMAEGLAEPVGLEPLALGRRHKYRGTATRTRPTTRATMS